MKHIRYFLIAVSVLLCLQSCFKDGYITEQDFSYSLTIPKNTVLGNDVIATVTFDANSPAWGYDYEFLIDDNRVSIPDLLLQKDSTLIVGDKRILKLNLTSLVTTMGKHKLVVRLHYNTWKTQSAEFQMDELITEIYGMQTLYSQPCDKIVTIEPLYDPKDNTDTLKWSVADVTGDNIRIVARGDGKYEVFAENRLPAKGDVVFSTRNLQKKVAFDFYEIPIENVTNISASYYVRKGETLKINPVIAPADAMEVLDVAVNTFSGDAIKCVVEEATVTVPGDIQPRIAYCLSTTSGGAAEGEFVYSYYNGGNIITHHVPVYFFDPITAFTGIETIYAEERTDWVEIMPQTAPFDSREPIECEIISKEYDDIEMLETSDGGYRFRSVNQRPSKCTVKFSSVGGVEAVTTIVFRHTVRMYVDACYECSYRFRLRYDALPVEWVVKPSFTVGLATESSFIDALQYVNGMGFNPTRKEIAINGHADTATSFVEAGGVYSYVDDAISSSWNRALQDFFDTYASTAVNAVLCVDETSDFFDVELVSGTVKTAYVYYHNPSNNRPAVSATAYNRLGCVTKNLKTALEEHSVTYWATSEERYSHIIKF